MNRDQEQENENENENEKGPQRGRVLTMIYYLNQDWEEKNGGHLRLYLPNPLSNANSNSKCQPRENQKEEEQKEDGEVGIQVVHVPLFRSPAM